jgi:hypothetical protein
VINIAHIKPFANASAKGIIMKSDASQTELCPSTNTRKAVMRGVHLAILKFFLIAVCLCLPWQAISYSITLGNKTYNGAVNLVGYALQGKHWDDVLFTNKPGVGVSQVGIEQGNAYLGNAGYFSIIPDAGDALSGSVLIEYDYQITHYEFDTFVNFSSTPLYQYYNEADVTLSTLTPTGATISTTTFRVSDSDSSVLLNLDVGVDYLLTDSVVPFLHNISPPTVIDPNISGSAEIYRSGSFNSLSLEVVPEPSFLSICSLGLILGSFVYKSKWPRVNTPEQVQGGRKRILQNGIQREI